MWEKQCCQHVEANVHHPHGRRKLSGKVHINSIVLFKCYKQDAFSSRYQQIREFE